MRAAARPRIDDPVINQLAALLGPKTLAAAGVQSWLGLFEQPVGCG